MALSLFLGFFLLCFLIGVPIPFAMILSGALYALVTGRDLSFLSYEAFQSLNNFILIAIPLFLLTAEIMSRTSVAKRLFDFANAFFGHIPGGLGHVNVVTSIIFSGMSGSAMADAGGIGFLSYRAMTNRGFSQPFSAALTASSACIGPIIPPSIPMIVYAMVASESIGKLFLGGVFPGLAMGVSMMLVVFVVSRMRGYPVEERMRFGPMALSIAKGILPALTPVVLLGTISFGVVTVTEGALITVAYVCLISGLVYRELTWGIVIESLKSVFETSSILLMLFVGMKFFGFALAVEDIPRLFTSILLTISDNDYVLILIVNLIFIVLGLFSDATVNILLFVPIVLPLAIQIGMDPIQFGVMVVLNTMIGLITPPFGAMVFFTSGITKVPIGEIIRESVPFIFILIVVLALVSVFPGFSTYLPSLVAW